METQQFEDILEIVIFQCRLSFWGGMGYIMIWGNAFFTFVYWISTSKVVGNLSKNLENGPLKDQTHLRQKNMGSHVYTPKNYSPLKNGG